MPNSVSERKKFGFYYINFDRLLKKANYWINCQKGRGQPIIKRPDLFFGLEKATWTWQLWSYFFYSSVEIFWEKRVFAVKRFSQTLWFDTLDYLHKRVGEAIVAFKSCPVLAICTGLFYRKRQHWNNWSCMWPHKARVPHGAYQPFLACWTILFGLEKLPFFNTLTVFFKCNNECFCHHQVLNVETRQNLTFTHSIYSTAWLWQLSWRKIILTLNYQ